MLVKFALIDLNVLQLNMTSKFAYRDLKCKDCDSRMICVVSGRVRNCDLECEYSRWKTIKRKQESDYES